MNLLHCTKEVTWDNQLMTKAGHTPHFKPDSGPEFSHPPPLELQIQVSLDSVRQCYKSIKRNKCTRTPRCCYPFFHPHEHTRFQDSKYHSSCVEVKPRETENEWMLVQTTLPRTHSPSTTQGHQIETLSAFIAMRSRVDTTEAMDHTYLHVRIT